MQAIKAKRTKYKAKRVFLKKGTCSHAFFYILDREWGHPIADEERAIDTLAGGILQQGYQCGMLWGASMAIGAEAGRRTPEQGRAISLAVRATQEVMESFVDRTKSTECIDISQCDFNNKKSYAKYMISGKFISCYKLAGRWAADAVDSANRGMDTDPETLPLHAMSCASEVVKKMGGSKEEMLIVAGLAGGLGLSGSGCGALAAAIWKKNLDMIRDNGHKPSFKDPEGHKILNAFYEATDYEIQCKDISGQMFNSIEEHTEFLEEGGCAKLIQVLGDS